jgi:hypothetical protein
MALALKEASRALLGAQASLPAMSALARKDQAAIALKATHSTQRSL